jgi:hypothetical protein
MSKIKLTLNEALQLKDTIQDKLIRYQFIFKNENSVPLGRKRNYDLKALVKKDEDLRQNMVTLKLLIHEANLFIPEKETHNIAYYVFLLSERKRQINNLKAMPTVEGLSYLKSDKELKFSVIFNDEKKTEWIDKLNKEYRDISNKLTELNTIVTIDLPFDPKKV